MTNEELQKIEDYCNAATEGPWFIVEGGIWNNARYYESDYWLDKDIDFIINSRTDLPNLVIAYKQQQEELERYKKALLSHYAI